VWPIPTNSYVPIPENVLPRACWNIAHNSRFAAKKKSKEVSFVVCCDASSHMLEIFGSLPHKAATVSKTYPQSLLEGTTIAIDGRHEIGGDANGLVIMNDLAGYTV